MLRLPRQPLVYSAASVAVGAVVLLVAVFLPGSANAAPAQYQTKCGVDLASSLIVTPGGPICGSDEGDQLSLLGEAKAVSFFGENGSETLLGSQHADHVVGGSGNDDLIGGRGSDWIDGGDDVDYVFGGLGDDLIRERRFGIRERFYGGPGDDVVDGGRGAPDHVYGGTGNDTLLGGTGGDLLIGGYGDDNLYGGPGRDKFDCGPGNDTVFRDNRTVRGDSEFSRTEDAGIPRTASCEKIFDVDPTGTFPMRVINGGGGRDNLVGTAGPDLIQGKGAADQILGRGGDDELEGDGATNQGGDLMVGGGGNDRIAGRAGNDSLYGDEIGGAGSDAPGNDEIVGSKGRDRMFGGPGNDLIIGAYDGDSIFAGPGHDVVTLLGGDTSDPNGRVTVNCGPGFDYVVINPDRRGVFRNCEVFLPQFHEADFGSRLRPSPETLPDNVAARIAELQQRASASSVYSSATVSTGKKRTSGTAGPAPRNDPSGGANTPSISADGDRVVYASDASNLIPNDINGERNDVFVRRISSQQTSVLSADSAGKQYNGGARLRRAPSAAISADGRYAVMRAGGVIRKDLNTGAAQRACTGGTDDVESPSISATGRFIVFEARDSLRGAPADRNEHVDIYRCDIDTGQLDRVSVPLSDSMSTSGNALDPVISSDGRFIAFYSDSGGYSDTDDNRAGIYLRDMSNGEIKPVDVPVGATTSNGNGENPRLTNDGKFLLFDSDATDLPGGDRNGAAVDVFRKDLSTGSVGLASYGPSNSPANGASTADSISPDGRYVTLTSTASNLVEGDTNGQPDIFVTDTATGSVTRVSLGPSGIELNGASTQSTISGSNRFVAFLSRATNTGLGGQPSPRPRVYRYDLEQRTLAFASPGLDLLPRTLIAEPLALDMPRRQLRVISGATADNSGVAKVEVSLVRPIGGGRCRFLARGSRTVARPCSKPVWLTTRLSNGLRFALNVTKPLQRGSYTLRARATDETGQVELENPGRNRLSLRLR